MRLLNLAISLFLTLSLQAQGLQVLDRVKDFRTAFHYTYYLSRNGEDFSRVTEGDVTVEDNAYILEGLGLTVTSDGKTRLSIDPQAHEAVLESINSEDLFTNPALFIQAWRRYQDRIKLNSSGRDSIDITLTLDDDALARFVVTGIVFSPKQGLSDFNTDASSLGSEYIVTDLR